MIWVVLSVAGYLANGMCVYTTVTGIHPNKKPGRGSGWFERLLWWWVEAGVVLSIVPGATLAWFLLLGLLSGGGLIVMYAIAAITAPLYSAKAITGTTVEAEPDNDDDEEPPTRRTMGPGGESREETMLL